ncbi:hypothetical protein AB0L74_25165 [Streptomyces sp. NPDC052020]|uniref:hypothetical protein n=1 Tax=Streptomyces sp. NPDC052020 TaxID=3155677 RepID=UPI00344A47EA
MAAAAVGPRLPRLEVTGVRAAFTYAGQRTEEVQDRIAAEPARRGGPGDAAARAHLPHRREA